MNRWTWWWSWDLLTHTSLLVWWFCWNVRVTKHEELRLPQTPRWRSTFPHPSQFLYNHRSLHCEREGLWPFLRLPYFCLCCFEVDTIISISKMGKQGLRAGKQPTLNFKVSRQLSQTNPKACFVSFNYELTSKVSRSLLDKNSLSVFLLKMYLTECGTEGKFQRGSGSSHLKRFVKAR